MIYTVTLNPSLDYIVSVKDFRLGATNRTSRELLVPGGKGINVSAVLKNLGLESVALGFTAGFTGAQIRRMVEQMGVRSEFIELKDGLSRINFKLRSPEGTEINGAGPDIGREHLEALFGRLMRLEEGDTLVLSGSIPPSLPRSAYREIAERLNGRRIRLVVDASGEALTAALSCRPFLVKPNVHELAEIFGAEPGDLKAVAEYARRLQSMGAANVLVSMAGDGALLAAEDGTVYSSPAPKGVLVNGVGAGDSMVAGFLAGWIQREDALHAFRLALAAGSAGAFSEHLPESAQIEQVCRSVSGICRW